MRNRDLILYSALGLGLWFLFIRGRNANPGAFMPNSPDSFDTIENTFVPLTVSSAGREFIKQREGFSAVPYNDATGQSIGYGHFLQAGENYNNITPLQASNLLDQDLVPIESAINGLVTVPVNQNQFDALADFVYNVGINAFKNSTLLKLLNTGDYAGASQAFNSWVYSQGNVNSGLQARRQQEQNQFNA